MKVLQSVGYRGQMILTALENDLKVLENGHYDFLKRMALLDKWKEKVLKVSKYKADIQNEWNVWLASVIESQTNRDGAPLVDRNGKLMRMNDDNLYQFVYEEKLAEKLGKNERLLMGKMEWNSKLNQWQERKQHGGRAGGGGKDGEDEGNEAADAQTGLLSGVRKRTFGAIGATAAAAAALVPRVPPLDLGKDVKTNFIADGKTWDLLQAMVKRIYDDGIIHFEKPGIGSPQRCALFLDSFTSFWTTYAKHLRQQRDDFVELLQAQRQTIAVLGQPIKGGAMKQQKGRNRIPNPNRSRTSKC